MNKDKRNNIQLLGTLNNSDESGIIANANQIYDANEDKSTQDVSKEHTERIKNLEAKEDAMQTTLENISKTGEASAASNVTYNHSDSKLDATNVQQAVDEVRKRSNYNDGDNIIDFNTIHIITDNPEFAIAVVDINDKILYGIKADGQPYWGVGVPKVVRDYVDKQVNDILGTDNITETIDSLKEVEKFLSDFKNSDTLKALLDTKANKTDVDNTVANINADIADKYKKSNPNDEEGNVIDTNSIKSVINNPEYFKAFVDNTNKLIEAIGIDGVRNFFAGINVRGNKFTTTDNPEFLFARIDSLNNLLFWIRKKDGGIDWAVGVPKPVKNYINAKVNELWNGNTLKGLLNEKVDKVNNKSLIDEIVANLNYSGDNPEFKYLAKHLNDTIAFGVKKDGTFFWTKGIPEHLVKYIKEQINKKPIHLTKPTSDNLCAFKCSDVETNWKGLNTMLFLQVKPWRPYYNNLSKYIEVLNSYNPSIVRTITWQYDITNPDIISQYDTVLYYIAKENKEILLTTQMTGANDYKNITDWEPVFANIEFLARRYNGENLIYPADDAEAEGLPVFVKYWEFVNEMNYKLSSTAQVNVQKRFYNLIKSINSSFKVMSLGYSDGTDKLVLTNQEYVNSYDIYNFHTYRFNLKDFISDIQEHLNVNNYALDKEFWLTEYGPSVPDNRTLSETFIANYVAIESLVALSFGASKCLYWANEYLVSNINPIEYYDTYNSLMFLYSIHGEGATKPILEENGGIYSLRWNFNNKVYTALYADKAINVDVVYNQSAIVYNYLGIQKEHKITQIDNNIIYIENSDNIIINIK